tara:strand:- start:7099 stop:8166 length:1068 start_codon:yes stop_codon:yes gene_type:complete
MKTTTNKYHSQQSNDRRKINAISNGLVERVTDLLSYFEIEYEVFDNRVTFACPVHGGDNPTAVSIFTDGDSIIGNWQCFTHHCETEYKQDILGFLQGVLSSTTEEDVTFGQTIKFACEFLESSFDNLEKYENNIVTFTELANKVFEKKIEHQEGISRKEIRERIQIPASYYIDRGFLPETLEKFDVGLCTVSNKPMSNRVVVPVYDSDHQYMIGCVGRATSPNINPKWLNSKGFNSGASLYNYWYAKDHILESNTAILVEGQGDVWRLYEAGIYNVVGMFGCSLGEQQRLILERSGALKLVIITDADEAGRLAREKIAAQCERMYNIQFVDLPQKDVGDMSVEEINDHIKPQLGI